MAKISTLIDTPGINAVELKQLDPAYFPLAKKFYKAHGQSNKTDRQDEIFAAYDGQTICACLRISNIEQYPFMRAVFVAPTHRNKGLAQRLIHHALDNTSADQCWTFPYQSLVTFYGQFGYSEPSPEKVPQSIRHSFENYIRQGRDIAIMQWTRM